MTAGELHGWLEDAITSGGPDLPVIVKLADVRGLGDVIYDVAAATKQGASFRVYVDPSTKRVIA